QLFDRRLTFRLAAFYADYKDVQIPGSVGAVVNGIPTFVGVTTNAAKARFEGIEFEGNAILARDFGRDGDRLNFSWALGWLNADYKQYFAALANPVTGVTTFSDISSLRRIQNTPEWTASGTLSYEVPVASGRLSLLTTLS